MNKMTDELKLKELKDGDKVYFKSVDDTPDGRNLGRAEFAFCVKWYRNKIKEVYIYHGQQWGVEHYYKVKVGHSSEMQIDSWTHKGIDRPNIWLINYLKYT